MGKVLIPRRTSDLITLGTEFSAKMPSASRIGGRSLEVCLRFDKRVFMCLSIPSIATILNSLSSSSKLKHKHHHNLDDTPRRLDTHFDILSNRFPVLIPDFAGPFALPDTTVPLFSCTVVGHTIYLLGGDPDDIEGLYDIDNECFNIYPLSQPPPPLPKPKISPPKNNIISNPSFSFQDQWDADASKVTSDPIWDWDVTGVPTTETTTLTQTSALTSPWYVDTPRVTLDPLWDWDVTGVPTTETTALTQTSTLTSPLDDHTTDSSFTDTTTNAEAFTSTWDINSSSGTTSSTSSITSPNRDDIDTTDPPILAGDVPSPSSTKTIPDSPTCSTDAVPESPNEVLQGICHKIWTFDLHNPDLGWSAGKSLISPRLWPILVPYQGKLYAFSGNHPSLTFAEVYDPISATWTELPPAPFRRLPAAHMYVVPLNGWNKLWVFGTHRPVDYTFDVLTRKWQRFRGARDIVPLFTYEQNLVSALTPEKHMVVYWIEEPVTIYAYSLSTNQLFKGTVSGIGDEEGLLGTPLVLHHLRRDLFCLIGITYVPDPERTILHVTFLQISIKPLPKSSKPLMLSKAPSGNRKAPSGNRKAPSKIQKTPPNTLTVAVLACAAYPLKGVIGFDHSYVISI
ncbi:hypothetical protein RND81_01G164200 [Saponaria officinalis]|uniref:Uncharacterized protein n=1 Tax=Saponaria officinalis TaxID=3572 RepID=A0AAW1NAC0_SAPOF